MNRFIWKDSQITLSQCLQCKHKRFDNKCEAFTDRIPDAILNNEFDHRERYPGDGGVRFQAALEGE